MPNNNKNVILACVLSALILISWTWFFEKPRMEKRQQLALQEAVQNKVQPVASKSAGTVVSDTKNNQAPAQNQNASAQTTDQIPQVILPKEEIIKQSLNHRIRVQTPELEGSINLQGLVFDDLTLVNYKETLAPDSKEVTLLSPSGSASSYYVNFGYTSYDQGIVMPDSNSLWKASSNVLAPGKPVTFFWQNNQKINFEMTVSVDEHYMFSVTQKIKNNSGKPITGSVNASIKRYLPNLHKANFILHEGPVGVFDGILQERIYEDVQKNKDDNYFKSQKGWLGITDKYWLTAIIPDKSASFESRFLYDNKNYQANYEVQKFSVNSGGEAIFENKMFAGAKRVSLLDEYAKKYDITRFDLAVDFGWYYFLTKPFFFILQLFSQILGNYGLAILAITIIVKLAMFPLANKSFTAMARIKQLQPKIDKIRETYKGKAMQMNKEIMELYKREKVNPVSGCLPMLIQIPVFFSLYKVLYVTIDMRHAPFYGWIHDLSYPDPTSIFNLFGLLPFEVHGILAIGIWPILMGATMIIQQKLNPAPSDPTQAKIMKILPYILIFVFAAFPAGLLIYWTWSNILSISQQYYITKKVANK